VAAIVQDESLLLNLKGCSLPAQWRREPFSSCACAIWLASSMPEGDDRSATHGEGRNDRKEKPF
jgi:hypothetical protein